MSAFKRGDKIRCIKPNHPHLNTEEIYTIAWLSEIHLGLNGVIGVWSKYNFEKVEKEMPKKTPRAHAELIKAWADGAQIQRLYNHTGTWKDVDSPEWLTEALYRIKPEPKPDRTKEVCIRRNPDDSPIIFHMETDNNVRLTWDGETGKLKAVELIK